MKTKQSILMAFTLGLAVLLFACSDQNTAAGDDQTMDEIKQVYQMNEVDEMPQFPGGQEAMYSYLTERLEYPESLESDSIEGNVFVSFTVGKQGGIDSVEVKQGVHPILDENAKEAIASMPDWQPGKKDGKSVNVDFVLPVKYKMN